MADFIPIGNTELGAQLKQMARLLSNTLTTGRNMQGIMTSMIDQGDFTVLESAFGLAKGDGQRLQEVMIILFEKFITQDLQDAVNQLLYKIGVA